MGGATQTTTEKRRPTCNSQAVSCCARAESFAFDKSAHLSPAATPAASAKLCHKRRGRLEIDGGCGGDCGRPPEPTEEPGAPLPTTGQNAYTVFFAFLVRNAWSSSRVWGRGVMVVYRREDDHNDGGVVVSGRYWRVLFSQR